MPNPETSAEAFPRRFDLIAAATRLTAAREALALASLERTTAETAFRDSFFALPHEERLAAVCTPIVDQQLADINNGYRYTDR